MIPGKRVCSTIRTGRDPLRDTNGAACRSLVPLKIIITLLLGLSSIPWDLVALSMSLRICCTARCSPGMARPQLASLLTGAWVGARGTVTSVRLTVSSSEASSTYNFLQVFFLHGGNVLPLVGIK